MIWVAAGAAVFVGTGLLTFSLCRAAALGDARADVASMRAEQRRRDALAHLTEREIHSRFWRQVSPDHPCHRQD